MLWAIAVPPCGGEYAGGASIGFGRLVGVVVEYGLFEVMALVDGTIVDGFLITVDGVVDDWDEFDFLEPNLLNGLTMML